MSDLIITINITASKRNGFMILKTFYTKKVDLNKSGKFKGGSISPADIYNSIPINNCNQEYIGKLFKETCYRVSSNAYYITLPKLNYIINELSSYRMLFLDNQDKSLVLVNNCLSQRPIRKPKYAYLINENIINWYSDCSVYLESAKSLPAQVKVIIPIPHLLYSSDEQVYSLYFKYNEEKIPFLDKRLSVRTEDIIYLRNHNFESKVSEILLNDSFTKLAGCRFMYSGHKNKKDLISDLSSKHIIVDDDENTIIPNIRITKSESGWFDIDLSYNIDDKIFDLASKIQLFSENNVIDSNNKKIMLPDSLIQAKKYLSIVENKFRINQTHIFQLLRIVYDSDSKITDFFSYRNVKTNLPDSIIETAFPYQLEGIKWLKFLFLNHFGGCLADDMGLGKTFQVISFLEDADIKSSIGKILIIVPKSLLTNWQKEFTKFKSSYCVGIYHGDKRTNFDFKNTDVIITTYNTAYIDLKKINEIKYSILIYDEIQTVKNYKSITSEAMKQIVANMKIGLSGTPMENSISELWNIMDILNPNIFYNHSDFMRRYNGKNFDELKNILNLFILRRMKKDVLKELPPKCEQIIYCDMDQKQKTLYTGINLAVKEAILNMKAFVAPAVLKGLTLLRECCCHPLLLNDETNVKKIDESCKFEALNILVDNLVESGHKILIFSNYTSMLRLIENELKKSKKYKDIIYYLDGKTKNRIELVNQFETAAKGIFLISIKAGGVGLNLVSAQDVIIYDPWWNPFVEQQAIDRAYRIGQNNPVTVYKLVVANTIEEKIVEMQNEKKQDFEELINGVSENKNFDIKDILKLLQ